MELELNAAYGTVQTGEGAFENIYDSPEVIPEPKKEECSVRYQKRRENKDVGAKLEKRNHRFNFFITVFAVIILVLTLTSLILSLVFYFSNQPQNSQQNMDINNLQSLLNNSNEAQSSELKYLHLQQQLNDSRQQSQEKINELERSLQNYIQVFEQQLNQSNQYVFVQGEELQSMLQQKIEIDKQQNNSIMELQNSLYEGIQLLRQDMNNSNQLLMSKLQMVQSRMLTVEKQLNTSVNEIQMQISDLQDHILSVERQQNSTLISVKNCLLPSSCKDLPQDSQSGHYQIQTSSGIIQVYCETNPRNCTCNSTGGWMRAANIDMTDPNQQCPEEFKLINRTEPPLRTCGRPVGSGRGCVSTTFPVHGIQYSHVCGRIIGYQIGPPVAFFYASKGIDSYYIEGISLTHGQSPRQHIWSFAGAVAEQYSVSSQICPCVQMGTEGTEVPPFVGNDYFCDTAIRGSSWTAGYLYSGDPLWDGQGCGSTSTCCEFNNPPRFCKQLPQPTSDDIELRICNGDVESSDDTPFEIVELYVT